MPFEFATIGNHWGKYKGETGKNTYEIDIVALSEKEKKILFAECKWKEKVNASRVLRELKEKAKFVSWNNEKRKEYYVIFAKSFREKIKEKGLMLVDLAEIEKMILGKAKGRFAK